jgi:ribonuclease-3
MTIQDQRRKRELLKLLEKLGVKNVSAVNFSLLDLALTHKSISLTRNYEHLEFLGDAVIRLVSAEVLLETYPHLPVGEFAAIRSIIVSDRFLAEIAEEYSFNLYLLSSPSVRNDKLGKMSRLADAFEAVLGALYESTKNMSLIRSWLDPILQQKAAEVHADPARENYKDALQEWSQGKYKLLPTYKVKQSETFNDENGRFTAEVWLKEELLGVGKGDTKKASQQAAAQQAYNSIILKYERKTPV